MEFKLTELMLLNANEQYEKICGFINKNKSKIKKDEDIKILTMALGIKEQINEQREKLTERLQILAEEENNGN